MKDELISRQFLIESFKEEFFGMYSDDFNYMIKWFEGLPTADSSEFCDNLWKIAYEHGKRDAQPSVITMKTDVDKESFRQVMEGCELTFAPSEIVHCKDCVYYNFGDFGVCDLGGSWDPDDFCSCGRRKTDG